MRTLEQRAIDAAKAWCGEERPLLARIIFAEFADLEPTAGPTNGMSGNTIDANRDSFIPFVQTVPLPGEVTGSCACNCEGQIESVLESLSTAARSIGDLHVAIRNLRFENEGFHQDPEKIKREAVAWALREFIASSPNAVPVAVTWLDSRSAFAARADAIERGEK